MRPGHWVYTAPLRLRSLFRRQQVEQELDEELRDHVERLEQQHIAKGLSPDEARCAALRAMGGIEQRKEECRDMRRVRLIDGVVRDVRCGVRGLRRSPSFTIVAIATLALGIGANTAIFSIVDHLLLRPLPYPDGEALVAVYEAAFGRARASVSPANWLDWQRESRSFESLAAWNAYRATLTGQGEPEVLNAQAVSAEFLSLVRIAPLIGRSFAPEEDRPRGKPVVILSYRLWQRKFGGDPRVLGQSVELNATPAEVIGVMPPGFYFISRDTDCWSPYALDRQRDWRETAGRFMSVAGRLKPSVTPQAAQREMATVAERLAHIHPFNKDTSATVVPLREILTGEVRLSLLMLFASVGVLLLIACFNVANLLLARAASRQREIAIRTSLGAGRWPIVRQLLVESLMLGLAGGLAGLLVARWGVTTLLGLTPTSLLRVGDVPLDGWVLFYTLALSLLTALVFGAVPAISATGGSLVDRMRRSDRLTAPAVGLRGVSVVAQVAMTVVLLSCAGLLVRSFAALSGARTGLDPRDVLTMRVGLPATKYDAAQRVAFFRHATERLRTLPRVQATGAAGSVPVTGATAGTRFHVQGEPELPLNQRPLATVRVATPGYFQTLGIPIPEGRDFTNDDLIAARPPVFIVNEAFAKQHLSARDPLTASMSVLMRDDNPYGRIVGIVGDVNEGSLRKAAEPTVFYNHAHLPYPGMTLFVRAPDAANLAREAVAIIRELDPNLPVTDVRALGDVLADSLARERLNAVVSAAFALSALLLASLGVYGLLGCLVAERTREIGVRMALGAHASRVVHMVLSRGLRLVAAGAVLGLLGAVALSQVMESLLFGVSATDPATLAGVVALLSVVSSVAAIVPARRASRTDPMVVLRC